MHHSNKIDSTMIKVEKMCQKCHHEVHILTEGLMLFNVLFVNAFP